jgi:hypothetical protein
VTSKQRDGTSADRAGEGTVGGRGGKRARRVLVVTGAIAVCAFAFTIAVALSTGNDPSSAAPGIVAAVTETPVKLLVPTNSPRPTATLRVTDSPTAEPTAVEPSVTLPPTIDGAWISTPGVAITPAPTTEVGDPVASMVGSIEAQYGVRVLTGGQDWGADEASQLRNLRAVSTALASMPGNVRAANAASLGGPLTFLSNNTGSTEGGWQPYGARAANFYSNEDIVAGTQVVANQVVLQPGSTAQTIAHEMMHAHQLRGLSAGDYAGALLTPEMKSFMQATGWTQLVSDDEVRADAGSWDSLNADFSYGGLPLAYHNEYGETSTLFAPNPLEAYAEAGGLYYAHSAGTTLPDWPEYWGWFSTNVG